MGSEGSGREERRVIGGERDGRDGIGEWAEKWKGSGRLRGRVGEWADKSGRGRVEE